jgi:acetylornithine deacetylase
VSGEAALPALARALVAVDSVNPSLVAGAAGETAAARLVEAWCAERGIETTWLEATPGRPSVVARVPGSGGGRSLMLNGHVDTVGVAGMREPFAPREEGGRLAGRGALDMKTSVAACLVALARLQGAGLRGDVLVTAVADEEHASLGTLEVLEHYGADAAVVTEPSDLDLFVAHRGFVVLEVTMHGLASHTSQAERGANAVTAMGRALVAIEEIDGALRRTPPHPLLGHGSLQAVTIDGGRELFTTPDRCVLRVERRTLPGEDRLAALEEIGRALAVAVAGDDRLSATVDVVVERDPFEVAPGAPIVEATARALRGRRGVDGARRGAPYWMDAALLAAAGIPTVVVGPTGGGMHAAEEWVDLGSAETLVDVLVDLARDWCA